MIFSRTAIRGGISSWLASQRIFSSRRKYSCTRTLRIPCIFPQGTSVNCFCISSGMARAASPMVNSYATARMVLGSSRKASNDIPSVKSRIFRAQARISSIRSCQALGDTDRLLQNLFFDARLERARGSQIHLASEEGFQPLLKFDELE